MHFISRDSLDFREQLNRMTRVQNIAVCGLFIALYIVLSRFNIRLSDVLEIRFAFLVLAAAGMFGGPVMGLSVGIASDIISTILSGQAFFPGFTFSYGLLGFLFGMVLYHCHPTSARCIVCSVVDALLSLFLNTFWLALMYYGPGQYGNLLITRLPKCAVMMVLDIIFLYATLRVFARVFRTMDLSSLN